MHALKILVPVVLSALALSACEADGGFPDLTGGGGGGGGGGGTPCIGGIPNLPPGCTVDPGLENFVCTQTAPAGTVASSDLLGPVCALGLVCSVTDAANAVDGVDTTFAAITLTVGLLQPLLGDAATLNIDLPGPVNAGNVAAFDVDFPGAILDATVLQALTITTSLNGVVQETAAVGAPLALDVLTIPVVGGDRGLIGFENTLPYNRLSISVGALILSANLDDAVRVFDACVAAEPAP